jgi:plasmid maintenance system antidote protein VapI
VLDDLGLGLGLDEFGLGALEAAAGQKHGGLVSDILHQRSELAGDEAASPRERGRDAASRLISGVQATSRVVLSLGKGLDLLPETLMSLGSELAYWRERAASWADKLKTVTSVPSAAAAGVEEVAAAESALAAKRIELAEAQRELAELDMAVQRALADL